MKRIKKILVILLVLLMCGCAAQKSDGGRKNSAEYDGYYVPGNNFAADAPINSDTASPSGPSGADPVPALPSKIIVTSEMEMESNDLTKTIEQIQTAVLKAGGYIQTSRIYNNDYDYYREKNAYIVVRVPADRYEEFLAASKEYGNVLSVNTTADDITTEYYDLSARLSSLQQQRERVMEFYKQAKTIDELILIEKRLSEIDSEIAAKQITMKNYDLLTNYSTVTFNLREVSKFTDTEDSFLTRLKNTLSNSFTGFMEFLEDALFFVINSFWYVLLIIGAILLVNRLNRKHNFLRMPSLGRKKEKKEEKEILS